MSERNLQAEFEQLVRLTEQKASLVQSARVQVQAARQRQQELLAEMQAAGVPGIEQLSAYRAQLETSLAASIDALRQRVTVVDHPALAGGGGGLPSASVAPTAAPTVGAPASGGAPLTLQQLLIQGSR